MSNPFTSFLIRIFDKNDAVIGGGFLVTNRHFITCAHVVADALGIDRFTTEAPGVEISIDFPLPSASQKLKAMVVHWIPMSSTDGEQPSGEEDTALLEIQDEIPPNYQPASLSHTNTVSGTSFQGCGFSQPKGAPIDGYTKNTISGGCVVLESAKEFGYFVDSGFSGTPIWSQGAVIGMIVRADESKTRTAYMIPSSLLVKAVSIVVPSDDPKVSISQSTQVEEEEQSDSVNQAFWEKFNSLSNFQQTRYKELAIFPEDVEVPLTIIKKLWEKRVSLEKNDNLNGVDVTTLCEQLHNLSLLKYDNIGSTVRLRKKFRRLLIDKDNDNEGSSYHQPILPSIHEQFLFALKDSDQSWAELSEYDSYCWKNLAYHAKAAGRRDDLIEIISSWEFLTKKTKICGSAMLELDLQVAEKFINSDDSKLRTAQIIYKNFGDRFDVWAHKKEKRFIGITELRDFNSLLQNEVQKPNKLHLTLKFELPELLLTNVHSCRFSHDGKKIVTASDEGCLTVWEAGSGRFLYTLRRYAPQDSKSGRKRVIVDGHEEEIRDCDFDSTSKVVVSASADHTLKLWDTSEHDVFNTLLGHNDVVNACCFSPVDGNLVASASDDCTLKIWDIRNDEPSRTFSQEHPVTSCTFGRNGKWVVSVTSGGILTVWDLAKDKWECTTEAHSASINCCSYFDQKIVTASEDSTLKVWKADSLNPWKADSRSKPLPPLAAHSAGVNGCCFNTDGKFIVSASSDQTVKVWDVATGVCRATFIADGPMYCCAMHGDMIVAGGARGVYFLRLLG